MGREEGEGEELPPSSSSLAARPSLSRSFFFPLVCLANVPMRLVFLGLSVSLGVVVAIAVIPLPALPAAATFFFLSSLFSVRACVCVHTVLYLTTPPPSSLSLSPPHTSLLHEHWWQSSCGCFMHSHFELGKEGGRWVLLSYDVCVVCVLCVLLSVKARTRVLCRAKEGRQKAQRPLPPLRTLRFHVCLSRALKPPSSSTASSLHRATVAVASLARTLSSLSSLLSSFLRTGRVSPAGRLHSHSRSTPSARACVCSGLTRFASLSSCYYECACPPTFPGRRSRETGVGATLSGENPLGTVKPRRQRLVAHTGGTGPRRNPERARERREKTNRANFFFLVGVVDGLRLFG